MQCPYCGYEYKDSELKCPFCGTENTKEARLRQRATIRSLDEEQRDIQENLPKRLRKQTDKKVKTAGASLLGVILAILVVVIVINVGARLFMNYAEKKNLETMERYLVAGDLDKLTEQMDEIGVFGSSYDKYTEVVGAYRGITSALDELEWYYEGEMQGYASRDTQVYYLAFAVSDCVNAVARAQLAVNDQLVLGNEAALEQVSSMARKLLHDTLLLTEEELLGAYEEAQDYYNADKALPLAELAYERMQENE